MPRPFSLRAASAFPSGLTLDALMLDALAAVFAAIAAAAVRAVAAFVASAASASARAADFSLRWRSALCTADALYLAAAEASAAVDPASWPYLPAASDTSDLTLYSLYSELPNVDRRADLSHAPDYSRALPQFGWFPCPAPLHAP
jgi:hypothetical protein